MNIKKWENDQSNTMWAMFMMGKQQKPDIPQLKRFVHELIQMSTQKTAGQRRQIKGDLNWDNLNRVVMGILCETTTLVLSGKLDELEKKLEAEYQKEQSK